MVYLGLNAEYLPPTGASGNYLPGGLKNYSEQKVITYSDSTGKIVQENVFVFMVQFLILSQKWLKVSQKVTLFFLFNLQTGECLPYEYLHSP